MIRPVSPNRGDLQPRSPSRSAVTMKEIARLANTSLATVSRVLANKPGVAPHKRKRIQDPADRLGFKPNFFASQLSRKEPNILAVMTSNLENRWNASIIEKIEEAVDRAGYELVVATAGRNPKRQKEKFLLFRGVPIAGMFYVSMGEEIAETTSTNLVGLKARGFPIVVIGDAPHSPFDRVSIDHAHVAFELGSELLRSGHQRIVYVSDNPTHQTSKDRTDGLQRALNGAGDSSGTRRFTALSIQTAPESEEGSSRLFKDCLAPNPTPTVVLCDNDPLSQFSIRMAEKMGLSIPNEVTVRSFDNYGFSIPSPSEASRNRRIAERVAHLALATLLDRIRNPENATIQCKVAN